MPRHSVSKSRSNTPPRQRRSPQKRSPQRDSPPPRRSEPQENATEPKVYVSGLPPNIKKEDLEEMFGDCGPVSDLFVVNKDSFSFAFVLYEDHDSAQKAINELNGTKVKGKGIKCEIAKPRPPRGNNDNRGRGRQPGNRGKGCFKCGQDGHFARQCPNQQDANNNNSRPPRREESRNDYRNNKKSDDERTASPVKRNRNRSESSQPRKNQRKRSKSSSRSVRQKKRESPHRRRNASPSSSRSNHKRRGGKHSRSRSAELRKGKKRVSRSSSSR